MTDTSQICTKINIEVKGMCLQTNNEYMISRLIISVLKVILKRSVEIIKLLKIGKPCKFSISSFSPVAQR